MRMTWKKRLTVSTVAAVSSLGLAVSAAQAGTDASASVQGASGYFGAYGEHLIAKDTLPDGHCARAQLTRRSDGALLGTSVACGDGGQHDENLSLPEGINVRLTVCVVEGSAPVGTCAHAFGTT